MPCVLLILWHFEICFCFFSKLRIKLQTNEELNKALTKEDQRKIFPQKKSKWIPSKDTSIAVSVFSFIRSYFYSFYSSLLWHTYSPLHFLVFSLSFQSPFYSIFHCFYPLPHLNSLLFFSFSCLVIRLFICSFSWSFSLVHSLFPSFFPSSKHYISIM